MTMQTTCKLCSSENHRIVISNIEDGTTFCYSLILIKGQVITKSVGTCLMHDFRNPILTIKHLGEESPATESTYCIQNSNFKILVGLHRGANKLILEFCGTMQKIDVNFFPRNTNLNVTPVYIICKGHDGRFQAPIEEDNSVESACKRISIGARLIQCVTAEKLHETMLERKTYQLAHDLNKSNPECVVFHSQLPVERARQMENEELWEYLGRELMLSTLGSGKCKFLAFLSCTRYCSERSSTKPQTHAEMLSMTEAHVALGGGGLALFGTACLHTWPQDVSQVMDRFLDETKVDARFMDDSCYRGTYGGCFATTLGSVCHELGHTFDLGHSLDGIMGRGFDHMDLVFTLQSCSDSDSCSEDGNRNIISPDNKDMKQHSTVNFTKVLEVLYTVSSPMKRPLKKVTRQKQSAVGVPSFSNQINIQNNNDLKVDWEIPSSGKGTEDQTFWSDSCAALLSFHRWFKDIPESISTSNLRFEPHRNLVCSPAGVRVIEIRDETGLVISSWQFLKNKGRDTFLLPAGSWCQPPHTLVAEDSNGNIIKHCF